MTTQHPTTNGATTNHGAPSALPQGIPSRRLIDWSTPRGVLSTRDLETVRDDLRERRRMQAPVDHTRTLGQCHLRFGDGTRRAAVQFMEPGGLGEPMVLTHHALRAFGREVLPGRGLDFLLEQIDLGEGGRKLSDMSFAGFSRAHGHTPRMIRTLTLRDPATGKPARAIRSVHSTDYAPYDNLEFVEDLLSGGYASHPLVSIVESDQGLRLRFLLGESAEVGKPIPMLEAWNSETGSRAVTVKPGMFRLVCTNGAGTWEESATFRWIHRGDRERIRTGVKDAITELRTSAAGVVKAYEDALEVSIDDAYAWFERAAAGEDLTKVEAANVRTAMHDETTTRGGLLASVVDAVTLAAQSAIDEFEQERMEQIGARLLRRGLTESLKTGGRLTAEA